MSRTSLHLSLGLAMLSLLLTPMSTPAADTAAVIPLFSSQKTVATGSAISGKSTYGSGIFGTTATGYGVWGRNLGSLQGKGYGGYFTSNTGVGVFGRSTAASSGNNQYAPGVSGSSDYGTGVFGRSDSTNSHVGAGVIGWGLNGPGGRFLSYGGNLIEGYNDIYFSYDTVLSLRFRVSKNGYVYANGSYNCGLSTGCFNSGIGADVAERIDASEALEPGSVVEIDPDSPGIFRLSRSPFSTLVVGVVSTNPAITMNNNDLADIDNDERTDDRPLLALVGQVPVLTNDENGSIAPGDLLVSSSTPGCAMRAGDDPPAGTVIGKALGRLDSGTGLITILVTLR